MGTSLIRSVVHYQDCKQKQKENVVFIIIVHHFSHPVQTCAAPLGDGFGSFWRAQSQLLIAIGTLIFVR
jgi:hypothetical protein